LLLVRPDDRSESVPLAGATGRVLAAEGLIVLGKVVEGTLAADLKIGMEMELATMTLFVDDDGVKRIVYAWRIAE